MNIISRFFVVPDIVIANMLIIMTQVVSFLKDLPLNAFFVPVSLSMVVIDSIISYSCNMLSIFFYKNWILLQVQMVKTLVANLEFLCFDALWVMCKVLSTKYGFYTKSDMAEMRAKVLPVEALDDRTVSLLSPI